MKSLELPFYINNEPLKVTIKNIIERKDISYSSLNWMVSHMVWSVVKSHFNEWLKIAVEYAAKSLRPLTKYDVFDISNSLFSFIINENDATIKYHFSESKIEDITQYKQIFCPYHQNKFKLIHEEISHLPMRLAIDPGFGSEKKAAEKYLMLLLQCREICVIRQIYLSVDKNIVRMKSA